MVCFIKKIVINYVVFPMLLGCLMMIFWVNTAMAVSMSKTTRTVPLNASGVQVTLSVKQLAVGQRKFNGSCAQCHLDGVTKTNPSVDLGPDTLALATPPRNTIESLVDYLEHPTTYDGLRDISELHPSTQRTDLFPKMRDLKKDDLKAIAGYILVRPRVVGDQWAGGKPKR